MTRTTAAQGGTARLSILAFLTYVAVYGLRKPWRAGTFSALSVKTSLSLAQTGGYGFGKLVGVGFVSLVPHNRILQALTACAVLGALPWLAVATLPLPFSTGAVALGAVPIACTWALVYRFIEGRECTAQASGMLGASLVVSGGVAKLVGRALLSVGVPDWWMPFCAAVFYLPAFLYLARQLALMPGQTAVEITTYGAKHASAIDRKPSWSRAFLSRRAGLVALLVVPSVFSTALRDLRDVFQADMLLGDSQLAQGIGFLASELPALIAILWLLPSVAAVDHTPGILSRSLLRLHGVMAGAAGLAVLVSAAQLAGFVSLHTWFATTGVSVYLLYVPLAGLYCDRLFSGLGEVGSAAVLIQALEAAGYAGSLLSLATVSRSDPAQLAPSIVTFAMWGGAASLLCIAAAAVHVGHIVEEPSELKVVHERVSASSVSWIWRIAAPAVGAVVAVLLFGRITGPGTSYTSGGAAMGHRIAGRTFYVDLDNTVADAWGRFRDNAIPQWPGDAMSSIAFLQDAYGVDPPMKGARQVLTAIRGMGGRVVILTARHRYENATAASQAWLHSHGIPYDDFTLVGSPREKETALAAAGCTAEACILIDDFSRLFQTAFPAFYTDVFCSIAGYHGGRDGLSSSLRARTPGLATVELFDLHHNNWQGLAARYTPWLVGVETALTPAVRVTSGPYEKTMMDRVKGYGMRVATDLDWDVAWLTKQTPALIHNSAAQAGLTLSPDQVGAWKLPGGSHQRLNAVPGVTQLVSTKSTFCSVLREAGLVGTRGFRQCFSLPEDTDAALSTVRAAPTAVWTYKPSTTSNGLGLRVLRSDELLAEPALLAGAAVLQEYVSDPILHKGCKTDVRFYVLVASFEPIQVYVHRQGYVRVAGAPYTLADTSPIVHVTNSHDNPSSVRLQYWDEYAGVLRDAGLDPQVVWLEAAGVAAKAVRAVASRLGCLSPDPSLRYYPCGAAFQQFGMDAIVDSAGVVWLLELNADPSLKFRNEAILADDVSRDADIYRMSGLLKPTVQAWQAAYGSALRHVCQTGHDRTPTFLYRRQLERAFSGDFVSVDAGADAGERTVS